MQLTFSFISIFILRPNQEKLSGRNKEIFYKIHTEISLFNKFQKRRLLFNTFSDIDKLRKINPKIILKNFPPTFILERQPIFTRFKSNKIIEF